jgi:hypothetical protein
MNKQKDDDLVVLATRFCELHKHCEVRKDPATGGCCACKIAKSIKEAYVTGILDLRDSVVGK